MMMTTEDIENYKKMVDTTSDRLQDSCDRWTREVADNEIRLNEEVVQKIHSVIGKSQLLLTSKFKQFRGFLNDAESKTIGKPVKLDDIRGFWETIYIQVDEVEKTFRELDTLKHNNYEVVPTVVDGPQPSTKKMTTINARKTTTTTTSSNGCNKKPTVTASSNLKNFISAQRERNKKLDGVGDVDVVQIVEKVPSNGHA